MLDIQTLREQPQTIATELAKRGFRFDVDGFLNLENLRKTLHVASQALQNERNQRSKRIGQMKAQGNDTTALMQEVNQISQTLEKEKKELETVLLQIDTILLQLPNIPHSSVPEGRDESANHVIKTWKQPTFDFPIRSHDTLGEALGQINFMEAAKITGSRFVVMKGQIAMLHRALIQFMLDIHTQEHGYQEIYVPYIVNATSLIGTGQLPKFEADLFKLQGNENYYLISTSEIPVTNTIANQILHLDSLPLRYVCHSPCFRSEAGSYGKDTKGMIRQHQFEKVELVWITTPNHSYDALEQLLSHAEVILKRLNLPYRVVTLCTGDLGGQAAKTYDLEVWLPSQNAYKEISSCSNTESYQARRMMARYRDANNKIDYLHSLNGSALAVGRTLVAILENYQTKEGTIIVPDALQIYLNGLQEIK